MTTASEDFKTAIIGIPFQADKKPSRQGAVDAFERLENETSEKFVENLHASFFNVEDLLNSDKEAGGEGSIWTSGDLTFVEKSSGATSFHYVTAGGVKLSLKDGSKVSFKDVTGKKIAKNRNQAETMADDFSTMTGWAAYASVTGGQGYSTYWITNEEDYDSGETAIENSYRWCVEQADTAGGGKVLFDVEGQFTVNLKRQIEPGNNVTIDAPARNATIISGSDITRTKLSGVNQIFRRIKTTSYKGETATDRDGLWVELSTADKFWITENTFFNNADGNIDVVSLQDITTEVRGTIERNHMLSHDKNMLIGSLVCYGDTPASFCSTALSETETIKVTIYENLIDHCSQRNPKAVTKSFVHSVNNVFRLLRSENDDGDLSACYGILAATGGRVLSEYDLFISLDGTSHEAINATTTTWVAKSGSVLATEGPGAVRVLGSIAENMSITEVNTGSVPTVPYSITKKVLQNDDASILEFYNEILSKVGSDFESISSGEFVWRENSTNTPDGFNIIAIDHTGTGRFEREHDQIKFNNLPSSKIPLYDEESGAFYNTYGFAVPRYGSKTISSGEVTFDNGYHTVAPESGSSDTLHTINLTFTPYDGQEFTFMSNSASNDLTITSTVNSSGSVVTGNILLPGGNDLVLDGTYGDLCTVKWCAHRSKFVLKR